jgi:chitodextrinase
VKKLVFLFAFLLVGVASAAPSVVSTTQTSATVENLDCGTKYRFEIRKYTASGDLSPSAEYVDAQTKNCPDTEPPSRPQNLAATAATETSISVSWSASTDDVGVTGYDLYRGGSKVDSTNTTSHTFGGLSCGTGYTFAVEAYDAASNRSAPSTITASTKACPPPSCPTGEYSAQYFGNMTLSGTPVLQRCESAINYGWGGGSPATGVPADRFSTRWTSTFSFTAGSYQFTATADDGVRVWVDGTQVIDAWKDQAATTYQATKILTAGDHDVKVEYYENGGGAVATVGWQLNQSPAPAPAPPPGPAQQRPLGFSTGCCITGNANRVRMLDEAAAAGIKRIRDEIWWAAVEPTNGSFNWTNYVSFVNLAKSKGIDVLYILQNTPAWANGGQSYKVPPTNPADFGDFCGQAARTLGPLGVRAFEVWNEANLQDYFQPRPDAAKYVELLKACYNAIKSVDPTIMVISSGLSPYGEIGAEAANGTVNPVTFLQRMYGNGAAGYFDALGWHPYSSEGATLFTWSGWSQMSETNASARSLMVANGDGAKRIWATEMGNSLAWCGGSETCQAERTRVQLEKWKAFEWAGPIYFYNQWAGLAHPEFSAARVDWSKRPIWNVLASY